LFRFKKIISKIFKASGHDVISDAVYHDELTSSKDLGPGISGSSLEYYGTYASTSGGDGSKWPHGLSSSGSTPFLNHVALRYNARSAYHDSIQARALIERYADLVSGVGLKLEASPNAGMLGLSDEEAEAWAQKTESLFDQFMSSKKVSRAEDMSGYQVQRFAVIQQQRDGEYFVRLDYVDDNDNSNPLRISFLDPGQIQGRGYTDTKGTFIGHDGIIRDKRGRETAYSVLTYDEQKQKYKYETLKKIGDKSGATLMLHGFVREYAAQTRGYSRISHLLQHFENLTDFELSHIKKAINESVVAMYVKPSKSNPASDAGFTDTLSTPAGVALTYDEPVPEGDKDVQAGLNYTELNEIDARPGSWLNMGLQGGEDLKTLSNTTPVNNYGTFVNEFAKSLSSSMSMPIEVVMMQFGQNYSASYGALVLAWQVVNIWRNELVTDFLRPIYEAWLKGEVAAGRVIAPGWADPRLREAWCQSGWIGAPMPSLDPLKVATAAHKNLEIGATTLDRVARELNGSSGRINRKKLQRELQELPASPLNPDDVRHGDNSDRASNL
jgi:lambda family phage portal protein